MSYHEVFTIDDPPPRPTTPPVRPIFLMVLCGLMAATAVVYGVPYVAYQTGLNWEAGRAKAASDALKQLDEAGVLNRSSALFEMATTKAAPAVVNIRTTGAAQAGRDGVISGLGSGVIINKTDGFIVTNAHVIKDAARIYVRLSGGRETEARLVGADVKTDLAVLQVPSGNLPAEATWGDSEELRTGEWVLAIGSPFALERTVTAGIVSATRRNNLHLISQEGYEDFIQTDAAINPGNSGGPLIDLRGDVVGINTAILSETGGNQGIGLAIPASMARRVSEQIMKTGRVVRGYIGVTMRPLGRGEAQALGIPEAEQAAGGVAVENVRPGSPAAKVGLESNDVIVAIDGKPIESPEALRNRVSQTAVGSPIAVTYFRKGQKQTSELTIEELPTIAALGFNVRPFTPEEADDARLPAGLGVKVSDVTPHSPADRAGLKPGMQIVRIGQIPIGTKAQCDEILGSITVGQSIVLWLGTVEGKPVPIEIMN